MFPDKMTIDHLANQKLAIKEMIQLVYALSRFENDQATLHETETIILGSDVYGLTNDDMQIIRRLQSAVELVIRNDRPASLTVLNAINARVVKDESMAGGTLRTGTVKIGGTHYVPPIPDEEQTRADIQKILTAPQPATAKALRMILYVIGHRLYWGGNKRTAFLFANYLMVQAGVGLVMVADSQVAAFNRLLTRYYDTDDGDELMQWLYDNCVMRDSNQ